MRRTKIVCTIGPASSSRERVEALLHAGMDVARLNFSHGSPEGHAAVIRTVRDAAARQQRTVAILQDLQGPKIRLGTFRDGRAVLAPGAEFRLTAADVAGTADEASVSDPGLPGAVRPGDRLLVADGLI
jgi:pyruvate kinase